MSMKNTMAPAGIESATFRFVAQHLNHCATVSVVLNPRKICFISGICKNFTADWLRPCIANGQHDKTSIDTASSFVF